MNDQCIGRPPIGEWKSFVRCVQKNLTIRMRFRHFDSLRLFTIVAQHTSFASAADALCLTKGAVSHQIRVLESELGFSLFERKARGIVLTPGGRELLACANAGILGSMPSR